MNSQLTEMSITTPKIVIRRTKIEIAQMKKSIKEQRLVTVADLSILVERLRERLIDYDEKKEVQKKVFSELKLARNALNQAIEKASL